MIKIFADCPSHNPMITYWRVEQHIVSYMLNMAVVHQFLDQNRDSPSFYLQKAIDNSFNLNMFPPYDSPSFPVLWRWPIRIFKSVNKPWSTMHRHFVVYGIMAEWRRNGICPSHCKAFHSVFIVTIPIQPHRMDNQLFTTSSASWFKSF